VAALLDNLLRFDALMADGGRIRPVYLDWDMEKHQQETAPFWRSERPRAYLPNFTFTNWRAVRGCYHIEFFAYDVRRAREGVVEAREMALLFDFRGPDVTCQEIVL
jgi:hypothetical protein